MNLIGFKELETTRLILRKLSIDDAQIMYDNWASDDEVTKYVDWPTHSSVEVSKDLLTDWVSKYGNEDFYNWGIVLKETNELIGNIDLVKVKPKHNYVEIGACIGKPWWNKGYVSEALKEVIRFCFEELDVYIIETRYLEKNIGSGRMQQKAGMIYEATLKERFVNNLGERDNLGCCYLTKPIYEERIKIKD